MDTQKRKESFWTKNYIYICNRNPGIDHAGSLDCG